MLRLRLTDGQNTSNISCITLSTAPKCKTATLNLKEASKGSFWATNFSLNIKIDLKRNLNMEYFKIASTK